MQDLATYLSEKRISQKSFALRVGVHQSYISRLCRGEAKLGLELAFLIQRETNGAVPASIWVNDLPPDGDQPSDQEDAA